MYPADIAGISVPSITSWYTRYSTRVSLPLYLPRPFPLTDPRGTSVCRARSPTEFFRRSVDRLSQASCSPEIDYVLRRTVAPSVAVKAVRQRQEPGHGLSYSNRDAEYMNRLLRCLMCACLNTALSAQTAIIHFLDGASGQDGASSHLPPLAKEKGTSSS